MQRTNIQMVGLAAGAATIMMWLLGYFLPDLMSTAPVGLEAAITGIITVAVGALTKPETTIIGKVEEVE